MVGRGGSGWRRSVVWVALLVLAGCLVAVAVALRQGGQTTAANVAQVISVVLGIPALVVSLWQWRRKTTTPVVLPEQVSEAKAAAQRRAEPDGHLGAEHARPLGARQVLGGLGGWFGVARCGWLAKDARCGP